MDQTKYFSSLILLTWIKLSTGDCYQVKSSEQTSTYVPINNTSSTAEASDEDLWQNHVAMFLFKYVAPVLIIVGTVGNLIAVITLQSRLFKSSSTSFLLSMLALCDVLVLNTDLMRWWLICAFHIDVETLSRYGCKMHYVFAYFSRQIASCTLVLLTVERTISVQFPLRCHDICSKKRIIPVWIAMAGILFCVNCHLIVSIDLIIDISSAAPECRAVDSWSWFIVRPWVLIDAFIGDFIPFLIICVGNVILVVSRRIRSHGMRIVAVNDGNVSSTIILLITVSIFFPISSMPFDLYLIAYGYEPIRLDPHDPQAVLNLLYASISILYYSNNAFEFIFYFVSGRKFRSAFLDSFGRLCRKKKANISQRNDLETVCQISIVGPCGANRLQ